MLWVVIGHSPLGIPGEGPEWENILYNFAYSFHMPLFMLVSGWLFYLTRLKYKENTPHWTYDKIVKDKAIRLLLPGLVFSIVAFVVKLAFPGEVSRQTDLSFSNILHAYLYPYDNPLRELWFIAILFGLMIMAPLWKSIVNSKWFIRWGVVMLLSVLYFWHPNVEFLCIGRVLGYAIWFYLGFLVSKDNIVEKVFCKNVWMTIVVGIVIYMLGIYTNPFITTIGGIILSFGIALIAQKYSALHNSWFVCASCNFEANRESK